MGSTAGGRRTRQLLVGVLGAAALLVVVGVPPGAPAAHADTFTHKETGEVLEGRLLGVGVKRGLPVFLMKTTDGERRFLPRAEWDVREDRKAPPAKAKPGEEPEEDAPAAEAYPWPRLAYKGKVRDPEWLEKAYQYFKDKILLMEGVFFDLGPMELRRAQPSIAVKSSGGPCGVICGRVVRVLGPDAVVVGLNRDKLRTGWTRDLHGRLTGRQHYITTERYLARIKGVDTKKLVENQDLSMAVGFVGTCVYVPPSGIESTIVDLRPIPEHPTPLTREQFVSVLKWSDKPGGIKLVVWKKVTSQKGRGKPKVTWRRIVVE